MVQCKKCGLVVAYGQEIEMGELPISLRIGGFITSKDVSIKIVCAKKACDFTLRIKKSANPSNGILEVLEEEIVCESYFEWIPGLLPRDHLEMISTKQLADLSEQRQREDKAWRDEQSRKNDAAAELRRKEDREWQIKQKRNDRIWRIVGGVITFIGGVAVTLVLAIYFGIRKDGTMIGK